MELKSALFVDFDNVYSGLRKLDVEIAERFARQPQQWMRWLVQSLEMPAGTPNGAQRRVLVRRCYFNPQVYQRFRPAFNRAGFEVIDCPAMTSDGKTSTDIHMVLDIVDLLQHSVHYDEFLVFSADADFTPVLRKLRRWDRRTTVLAVGFPSSAYQASADLLIAQDDFIRHALDYVDDEDMPAEVQQRDSRQAVAAQEAKAKAVVEVQPAKRAVAPGKIAKASADAAARAQWAAEDQTLFDLARQIHDAIAWPLLPPQRYRSLLNVLQDDLAAQPFHLRDTGKRVRDACKTAAQPVSRAEVNTLLRGLLYSGHAFGSGNDTMPLLADRLAQNVIELCRREQMLIDERFVTGVRRWIGAEQAA